MKIFSVLSTCAIISCAKVEIPDIRWCIKKETGGAVCFTSLSNTASSFTSEEWEKESFNEVCTHHESFTKIKETLIKFCEVNKKRCELEAVKDGINKVYDLNDRVQKKVKNK